MKLFKQKIRRTFSLDSEGHFVSDVVNNNTVDVSPETLLQGTAAMAVLDRMPESFKSKIKKKVQETLDKVKGKKKEEESEREYDPSDIRTKKRFASLDELNEYYRETNPVGRSKA